MRLKRLLERVKRFSMRKKRTQADSRLEKFLVTQGNVASRLVRACDELHSLADAEFSIFSQWGEDGIIEWLIHHNGDMPERFIEFGIETYQEANTRFLLMNRNWRGLVIDGSASNVATARSDAVSWRHDLTTKAAFITKDNINELISSSGFNGEIGLLSIDIDGNDYWVWDAITCVSPHFIIAEYNSAFGDIWALTIPYNASFNRNRAHHSNLYYGASIVAFSDLATRKGYTLLGSNRAGSNAFFVRNDRASGIVDRIADLRPRPSRFREARDRKGNLIYVRGSARSDVIAHLPVVCVTAQKEAPLNSFDQIYSQRWAAMLDGR